VPTPALDMDLRIEHRGHSVLVQGSGRSFDVRSAHLITLARFLLTLWPLRDYLPDGYRICVQWRLVRLPVRF
jgi:hypothetical protein